MHFASVFLLFPPFRTICPTFSFTDVDTYEVEGTGKFSLLSLHAGMGLVISHFSFLLWALLSSTLLCYWPIPSSLFLVRLSLGCSSFCIPTVLAAAFRLSCTQIHHFPIQPSRNITPTFTPSTFLCALITACILHTPTSPPPPPFSNTFPPSYSKWYNILLLILLQFLHFINVC